MYHQLGNITFEGLKGFSALGSREAPSLAQHAVIDGKPKLQRTGDTLDEYRIAIMFHSRFCNPETEVGKLKSAMRSGEILPLIVGTGETLGNFVISEIEQDVQHTTKEGAIIMTRLNVSLLESAGSDPLSTAMAAAKSSAFANAGNNPVSILPRTVDGSAIFAAKKINEAVSLQTAGTLNLNLANSSPSVFTNEMRKAQKAFEGVQGAIASFEGAFDQVQAAVANAAQIKNAATIAKTYATSVVDAVKDGDVTAAISSNRDLRNGLTDLKFHSGSLINLVATRRI